MPQARMKAAAAAEASLVMVREETDAGAERSRRLWLGHRLDFVGVLLSKLTDFIVAVSLVDSKLYY